MRNKLLKLTIGSLTFSPVAALADSQQCAGVKAVGGTCDEKQLPSKINDIVNILFIVVGSLAVIILIIGGIRYITSTGDSARIQKAKDTILYAIIGIIVVILARAIVGFVVGQF